MGQETAYGDTRPAIDCELLLAVMRIGYVGGSPVRATWWRNYTCTGLGEVWKQRHGTLSEPGIRADRAAALGIVERKHLSVDVSFVEATAKQSRIPWWTRPLHHSLR